MNAERKLWERDGKGSKPGESVVRHPEFAKRFNDAADMNPNVPPMRSGRYVYVRDQLSKRGQDVSIESVRKWFAGESMPHKDRADLLAEILKVDSSWLLFGTEGQDSPQKRRARNAMVDGAVNLVAGIAAMDGAVIAFPEPDDRYASAQHVDMHAIIRGANYPIHVVVAEEHDDGHMIFSVPTDLRNTVPIGLVRLEGFNFGVYEITDEAIEFGTAGTRGKIEVNVDSRGVREINSFKDRF